jgi:kinetochore protein Nuf2
MSQFSFPILENEELMNCLEEMELSLDPAQLSKPTFEVVKPLFENALTNLSGITRCVEAGYRYTGTSRLPMHI